MVKEKIKRFVMVGERNASRIKKMSGQMNINDFVCKNISNKKPESSIFPKVTVWDIITGKADSKISHYANTKFNNGVAVGLRNAKIELVHNINKMIDEDK